MNIYDELNKYIDINYALFQKKIVPTETTILGVRIPILRKIAKRLVKENDLSILNNIPSSFEETLLQGLVIGYYYHDVEQLFKALDKFFPFVKSWAVVDTLVSTIKISNDELDKYFNYLKKYAQYNDEYIVRFCIVSMLHNFIDNNYQKYFLDIFDICKNIKINDYYVEMAISWLLSISYIKNKDMTMLFLKQSNISNSIFKKTIRKILDSNQLLKEEKEELKKSFKL